MKIRKIENKRGVMGLSKAQAFLVGILSLVIIGVLSIIVLGSLKDSTVLTTTFTVLNESSASANPEVFINDTGYTLDKASVLDFANPSLFGVINNSNSVTVASGNWTITAAGVVTNATSEIWDDVNMSYTYTTQGDGSPIVGNATTGLVSFFSNVGTWLTLLSVVVIILIIATVIVVVNRFGEGGITPRTV